MQKNDWQSFFSSWKDAYSFSLTVFLRTPQGRVLKRFQNRIIHRDNVKSLLASNICHYSIDQFMGVDKTKFEGDDLENE